jgi:two-component system, NtrC family, response regulator AtoC
MSARARILVADDEDNLRRVLQAILKRDGYEVVEAENGAEALRQMNDSIDVVITDLKMPEIDGMEVLRRVITHYTGVPVIMITAHGSVGHAVEAVKTGAFDYIEKPFEQQQIRVTVEKAVKQAEANRSAPRAAGGATDKGRFGLVGQSNEMNAIYGIIEKVADTPSTVLISGESGTGKELVAKALHERSSRSDKPFIKINCAAIPKTLMESEMFGYEKGAFTGASSSKPGRFELADGGTLFLDEIGEIPVEMQVKLLRAIQESEFERVGGIKTLKVDVRLITATNRDLEKEVKDANFREDLFYRLNVVPLKLPPLRERRSDIPLLVDHILKKFNERLKKSVDGISREALDRLCERSWPGNIRELENVLERTILFCSSSRIEESDLPREEAAGGEIIRASASHDSGIVSEPLTGDTSLKDLVRAETSKIERELIAKALDETSGNVTQAAKKLKISRKSLQMKMKDFGLRDRDNGS